MDWNNLHKVDAHLSIQVCPFVLNSFFFTSTIRRFWKKQLIVWFFEPDREYFAAVGDSNVSNNTPRYPDALVMTAFCHQQHLQLATKWKFI